MNLGKPNVKFDRKINHTIKTYLINWFKKNNRVIFFIASDEDGKAVKRVSAFTRWFTLLPEKQRIKFEFITQNFQDKTKTTYIGFMFRKDYPKYNDFKLKSIDIMDMLEASKNN